MESRSASRNLIIGALAAAMMTLAGQASAADASALKALPSEVVGVMGSGDQLSLRLTIDGAPRTLEVGKEYKDGWRLQALSADMAILTKGGDSQKVGLNPEGIAPEAPAAQSRSKVVIAGDSDTDILRNLREAGAVIQRAGLTDDEAGRMAVYAVRLDRARAAKQGDLTPAEIAAVLGDSLNDWLALDGRENVAVQASALADFARTGAVSFYVPAGEDYHLYATAAGVPAGEPSSYTSRPADDGGRVYTRQPVTYVSRAQAAGGN